MKPVPIQVLALALHLITLVACTGVSPPSPQDPTTSQTAARPAAPAPQDHNWARGAVFYEVFVRSFSDSDGDGVGDLRGLISKLDYLNDGDPKTTTDLGVDALWLMPVFQSPSCPATP